MNTTKSLWLAALIFGAALAATLPVVLVAAEPVAPAPPAPAAPSAPPAPPAPPAPVVRPNNAELDRRLEQAQRRLEQAASEVARLSTQLSTSAMQEVMPMIGSSHAIIGVQLESAGDSSGARVREVSPGGPAAEAGIRTGDVVVAVNGTAITADEPTRQVVRIMREVKPDSRVAVRVLRNGKPQEFTVTARGSPMFDFDFSLNDWPEVTGAFMFHRPLMDMELATISPQLGSYFGTDKGVLVVRAPTDGALKLEDGDVILAIDGRQPTSGSHATRILGSYQPGEKVTLRVLRRHKTEDIVATLPEHTVPEHRESHRETMRRAGAHPDGTRKFVIFGTGTA
ncbi:MAG TPA: PDZ domain-containing protein [Steroidobacteraceae bacterium]|nr:PDZ domain-containing protein [Steroidobacteraceae bacterium]